MTRYSSTKVSQSTVDQLRKGNMAANLARANSGKASAEYVEAARRFYGNRVKGTGKPIDGSNSSAKGTVNPASHVRGSGSGKKTMPGGVSTSGQTERSPQPVKRTPVRRFIPEDRLNKGSAASLSAAAQRKINPPSKGGHGFGNPAINDMNKVGGVLKKIGSGVSSVGGKELGDLNNKRKAGARAIKDGLRNHGLF